MIRSFSPFVLILALSVGAAGTKADDWLRFRGPNGQGQVEGKFPLEWSADKNIKWRTPLPAPGNSSPIVVKGKVFVTQGTDQGKQRHLICFDRTNGKELWRRTIDFNKVEDTHKTNPYCSASPTSDGERVVCWHGSAGTFCYDLNGELQWSRDLGTFHHIWGEASSPIIHGDRVYQICGPGERTFVIALDKKTGETVWESPIEPDGSASDKGRYVGTWATPLVITQDGKEQLLCALHKRVVAYDIDSGKEVWSTTGISSSRSDLVYTSPLVTDKVGVVFGGYGGPMFAFRLGGMGDVTEVNRMWHIEKEWHPQRIGSGVILGDKVFMANADNSGSIQCFNIENGEVVWEERRTSSGPHWGAMLHNDGKLYVQGQNGKVHVFAANPEKFELLADNDLGETSNSTPAFSDGDIFIRTHEALYCVSE
ncbi:MAG: PQQ-binding-like beta-propeller repeat protein [Planctomycetaceae bacterium]|nr:PQQ-binding-like beta-propeller repeat protein [Planctomycetaceae bacterium]MCB9952591.1 PQQ-binding-like beta-propeller repeat protein [Planctomycetaceae bacterium]